MYKKIFFTAIIFTVIASCKQAKPGFQYSEDIVDIEKDLRRRIDSSESQIKGFAKRGHYGSIGVISENMAEITQEKIDKINKIPLPNAKGAETFRSAVIHYFGYMKTMYVAYKKWANAANEEQRESELKNIERLAGQSGKAVEEMQIAHRKYADANGFRLKK